VRVCENRITKVPKMESDVSSPKEKPNKGTRLCIRVSVVWWWGWWRWW
jgi:hypothetical protein